MSDANVVMPAIASLRAVLEGIEAGQTMASPEQAAYLAGALDVLQRLTSTGEGNVD